MTEIESFFILRSLEKLATKKDLKKAVKKIMSAISDFATAQNAFFDRMEVAKTGITADLVELKRLILELQNSPGVITPEDQALLDALQTRANVMAANVETLDAMTPPVVPTA